MDSKPLENLTHLGNFSEQLFDNPLRKEFLTFDQIVEFFGYSQQWVRQQMASGNLPYRSVGKSKVFFYVPEVRQAILEEALVPGRKVQNDNQSKNQERKAVQGETDGERIASIQDL